MQNPFIKFILIVFILYVFFCLLLYFFQEKLIFFPQKLDKHLVFRFSQRFEELNFTMQDQVMLNGILFHADRSNGLIFYLHGNTGSVDSWGDIASTYTDLNYDVLMIDYRGYGKSDGVISSQSQLLGDMQSVYDSMKSKYDENRIIILGYSLGTGPAAKLASVNHPKMLILQAPYHSIRDMARHRYPIIPSFLLKYKMETNTFITACKMPIVIFHGTEDGVIYYGSSVKLQQLFKRTDTLITLRGQGHNGITENQEYLSAIKKILAE